MNRNSCSSTRRGWGYRGYHGSLSGGGWAIEDTMSLFQGGGGYKRYHGSLSGSGGAIEDTMGLFQGMRGGGGGGGKLSQDTAVSIHFGGSRACIIVLTSSLNVAIENAANKRSGLTLSVL